MTRLYAYCLCDDHEGARLDFGGAVGVGGAPARAIEAANFVAVVSDYAGERIEISRADLLAHNRINGLVLALTSPLPFRFGTLVTPAQLDQYAARDAAALRARLARVRGCVEMSVKLIRPLNSEDQAPNAAPSVASADTGTPASSAESVNAPSGPQSSGAAVSASLSSSRAGRGTAYLAAKRRALLGDERLRSEAEALAARLRDFLSEVVRESSERLSPAEALVLRAAYLVERVRVAEYQSRLREFGAAQSDLRLLASGPWPPYSFAA
jgi:hypothetical protein